MLGFGMNNKPPPTKCPDCGGKLGPVNYGVKYEWKPYRVVSPPYITHRDPAHYRECSKGCGCGIVWCWPHNWVRRHVLPLWDMKRTVVQSAP